MKARKITESWPCVQFHTSLEQTELSEFFGKEKLIQKDEHGFYIEVHGYEGIVKARETDWIILNKRGSHKVVPNDIFKKQYEVF